MRDVDEAPTQPAVPALAPTNDPERLEAAGDVVELTEADLTRARRLKASFADRSDKARKLASTVVPWLEERRKGNVVVDVGLRLYERDIEAVGNILGAAIAFRLFLFLVPLTLIVVGLLGVFVDSSGYADLADQVGMSGGIAASIQQSLSSSDAHWVALLTGAFGTLWAGRNLVKALTAANTLAWRLDRPRHFPKPRVMLAFVGIVAAMIVSGAIVNRIRVASGLALAAGSMVVIGLIYAGGWFVLSLMLPRATKDPSALLPGAALVGLVIAGMQWFTQINLTDKVGRASSLYGNLGIAVVTLGALFIIGRLVIGAAVVNAVVFERFGSIALFVFGIPGIRRLPRRYLVVARFFALDVQANGKVVRLDETVGYDEAGPPR